MSLQTLEITGFGEYQEVRQQPHKLDQLQRDEQQRSAEKVGVVRDTDEAEHRSENAKV